MTPRLLLLTGPAAGDVAAVLRAATPAADPRQGASCDPWWDEVRDYEQAPRSISDQFCGTRTTTASGIQAAARRVSATDAAIRSLPGGEAWLVGLVLPCCPDCIRGLPWPGRSVKQPTRLAILAPEPLPLLVERVKAWKGEVWTCSSDDCEHDGAEIWQHTIARAYGPDWTRNTWPEAVRAALGES